MSGQFHITAALPSDKLCIRSGCDLEPVQTLRRRDKSLASAVVPANGFVTLPTEPSWLLTKD